MATASPAFSRARILETLRSTFGFSELRPLQEEVITSILGGQDVFVLMPTGGGKSLCYQPPAVLKPGVAVVVSPLIALMKDQVDRLASLGVAATFINSSLSYAEVAARQEALRRGQVKLLYAAPERLMTPGFLEMIARAKVSLFAIDEAHCISEWGHDFRPEYRELRRLRELFPHVPIAAFTATATQRVQQDIAAQLQLTDVVSFRGSLNRPNIFYQVWPKMNAEERLLEYLGAHADQAGIIYVQARASAERWAARLEKQGVKAMAYHAGLSPEERRERQEAFLRNDARIMVATIAFGMGIDKPDIRFVVHVDMPKNLEGYAQETGRAGRDGLPSDTVMFYTYGVAIKHDYFIKQRTFFSTRETATDQLDRMVRWAENTTCRREALLAYFDEDLEGKPERCCDICNPPEGQEEADFTIPAQKFLSCVKRTGERFGVAHVAKVLLGSQDKRVLMFGHDKLSTWGIGTEFTQKEWTYLATMMRLRGYIQVDNERYGAVVITPLGSEVLFQGRMVTLPVIPGKRAKKAGEASPAPQAPRRPHLAKGETARETLDMFFQGKSPAEIAQARNLSPVTIEGHLAEAIKAGAPVDMDRLVRPEKRKVVQAMWEHMGPGPLKPIKEALGEDYSYGEIKYVRAMLDAGKG